MTTEISLDINNNQNVLNFEIKNLNSSGLENLITKSDGYLTWSVSTEAWVWKNESYSLTSHNHDLSYASILHNHDSAYSLSSHNHDYTYSGNAFSYVMVDGQTTVAADNINDYISLKAGTNITITTDDINKEITINSIGGSSDPWTYKYITIDKLINGATNWIELTDLNIDVLANTKYEIEAQLIFTTTATTEGLGLSTTYGTATAINRSSISYQASSIQSKDWSSSGANNGATPGSIAGLNLATLTSFLFTSTATIYKINAKQYITNGTQSVTIKVGSFVRYKIIG